MQRVARGLCLLLLCTAGCAARIPPELTASDIREITVADVVTAGATGQRVRWGGTIAGVEVKREETCLQIVARPLDRNLRPQADDRTAGRFWACRKGFLDPEIYQHGRRVTVVGRVRELREGTIGELPYRFPVVEVEGLVLWPRVVEPQVRYVVPGWYWWDPWLWGPPYNWPGWYGRLPYR